MRIDLLVQKTVVHNFLRIRQSTFPLQQPTVQMQSIRSSAQTMTKTLLTSLNLSIKYHL